LRLADFKLIAFDMDSTLINIECVDEIADFAGRKAEVAAITEAAMRGEITDYAESLRRRVALLAGLPERALLEVYEKRLQITPGAPALIDRAHAAGLKVLLVSGGFTFFTERLRPRLSLDFTRANQLVVANGCLTGELSGPIVDASVKQATVEALCAELGCAPAQAIVVGDGANDLKMMAIAGVSVAYRAKPVVRAQTTHALDHCGLDALLNCFEDSSGTPVSAP
jgi:phosphoserine phosphatase